MAATAAALSSVSRKPGRSARARSAKSWIDSDRRASGGGMARTALGKRERRDREQVLSAHAQRLAAGHERVSAGQSLQAARATVGAAAVTCSKLSRISRTCSSPQAGWRAPRGARSLAGGFEADRARDRGEHASVSRSAARSTKNTPPSNRSISPAAARSASRVFPVPPGPISVSSRACSPSRGLAYLPRAALRAHEPRRLVGEMGAPPRESHERREVVTEAWMPSWKTRSGAARSLSGAHRGPAACALRELVADELGAAARAAPARRAPRPLPRGAVDGRSEVVASRVGASPACSPIRTRSGSVSPQGSCARSCWAGRRPDGVAAELKTAMNPSPIVFTTCRAALDGSAQDGVVAHERLLHRVRVLLPEAVLPSMSVKRKVTVRDAGSGRVGSTSVAVQSGENTRGRAVRKGAHREPLWNR